MAIGRTERMAQRRARIVEVFGESLVDPVTDVLTLLEFAWHDCYDEVSPPDAVIEDIFVCSRGELAGLAHAAAETVKDFRDVRMWADDIRAGRR